MLRVAHLFLRGTQLSFVAELLETSNMSLAICNAAQVRATNMGLTEEPKEIEPW